MTEEQQNARRQAFNACSAAAAYFAENEPELAHARLTEALVLANHLTRQAQLDERRKQHQQDIAQQMVAMEANHVLTEETA